METKSKWNLRNIYLYLVSFVTLIMIIVGTVQFVQGLVETAFPQPEYYPGQAEIKMRADNEGIPIDVVQQRALVEKEQREKQIRYNRVRRIIDPAAFLVVAVPVYLYHWRKVRQESQLKKAE